MMLNGLAVCVGVGGLELGLKLALGDEYRCVGYIEREGFAAAALVAGMETKVLDTAPIWDDVTTFEGARWRGLVDIISAGFPCQPWSLAGRRKKTDDERWIWPTIKRIIADVAPPIVFLENVSGLLSGGLQLVLEDLAKLGYNAEWGTLSAADVGAPHQRKRVFILAYAPSKRLARAARKSIQGNFFGPSVSSSILESKRPNWPPEPNSSEWAGIAKTGSERSILPSLEPELRGVADGVAHRTDRFIRDRLRTAGDGVVPVVAAVAFIHLVERICEDKIDGQKP